MKKNETKQERVNVYQMVTDRIMEQLQHGIVPWQQLWMNVGGTESEAINYVTRKPYSWLNTLLLGRTGEFLTWKQLHELGGTVKKGARAGLVVFYTHVTKRRDVEVQTEDGGETETRMHVESYPVLKYFHVFHLDDVEGIDTKIVPEPKDDEDDGLQPDEVAEDIISAYLDSQRGDGLTFHNDKPSARALYSPTFDSVTVPMLSQYKVMEEYYSTTFHELVHSTAKASRLNRQAEQKAHAFGSQDYSREELVAEMGSAMLCQCAGLDCQQAFKNSVAYISGWLSKLKDDNKAFIWAANRAEKAARYIMGERKSEETVK